MPCKGLTAINKGGKAFFLFPMDIDDINNQQLGFSPGPMISGSSFGRPGTSLFFPQSSPATIGAY
nr:hypothetical protein [uncultured Desulfobacter sp.]